MATFGEWFLAVILGAAAAAKLQDRGAFLRVLVAVPWLTVGRARALSRIVPVVEALVAGTLVAIPQVGGPVAVALLALFTGVIANELRVGRRFECGCFGAGTSGTAGAATLMRNGLLLIIAAVVILGPAGGGLGAVLTGFGAAMLLLLIEATHGVRSAGRPS